MGVKGYMWIHINTVFPDYSSGSGSDSVLPKELTLTISLKKGCRPVALNTKHIYIYIYTYIYIYIHIYIYTL